MDHRLALLAMRVLSVGWASYTIWRTQDIENRLQHLISDPVDSACHFDLFRGYFEFRLSLQVRPYQQGSLINDKPNSSPVTDPRIGVKLSRPSGVGLLGLAFD